MKNILFATTALVATTGFASAEVTGSGAGTIDITGWAEIGVIGGELIDVDPVFGAIATGGTTDMAAQFHTDIDVNFSMEGTADNGLTFGASVDLDENGAFGNTTQGGETYFISGGGATLTMGDTNGAFDQAIKETNLVGGSIADNEEHIAFGGVGNNGLDGLYDGQIARFDYAFNSITASISAEIDDTDNDGTLWGLGVRYEGDFNGVSLGLGLGYQAADDINTVRLFNIGGSTAIPFTDDAQILGVSVDAGFSNGLVTAISYSDAEFDGLDVNHLALGAGYEMNALAIGVNYGRYTVDGDAYSSGVGIAASYDLGGGLEAQMGYGHNTIHEDFATTSDDETGNTWSLGLAMSF